ncbi:MAG: cytochrome c3 family protein [Planctomycetes bacterium]|nr:cytochrome c3 family protein [Planctomycetota bacterium]
MTVLFPKWTNKLPALLALGAAAIGLSVVSAVNFWFSPKHTDVGYQPYQPVPYSHKLHAGLLGMDCRYCHRLVESGPHATIPDNDTCMGCHAQVKKDSPLLEPLRTAYGNGRGDHGNRKKEDGTPESEPLAWVKVHMLPDYAYFNHAVHVRANVGCTSCHGHVEQMEVVRQVEPLSMGWCLECHRDPTPHIRPRGVSATQMDWTPTPESIAAARARLSASGDSMPELNPPTHCSACHR